MVAVPLIFGRLTANDYEDAVAADARIDALRERMCVVEHLELTADYIDPEKRAIGNALQVVFRDGTRTAPVRIDYPLGHRRRRDEGIPLLLEKFRRNLASAFDEAQARRIEAACADQAALEATAVDTFVDLWIP
jgi:2-methylcitrate dehydratase